MELSSAGYQMPNPCILQSYGSLFAWRIPWPTRREFWNMISRKSTWALHNSTSESLCLATGLTELYLERYMAHSFWYSNDLIRSNTVLKQIISEYRSEKIWFPTSSDSGNNLNLTIPHIRDDLIQIQITFYKHRTPRNCKLRQSVAVLFNRNMHHTIRWVNNPIEILGN